MRLAQQDYVGFGGGLQRKDWEQIEIMTRVWPSLECKRFSMRRIGTQPQRTTSSACSRPAHYRSSIFCLSQSYPPTVLVNTKYGSLLKMPSFAVASMSALKFSVLVCWSAPSRLVYLQHPRMFRSAVGARPRYHEEQGGCIRAKCGRGRTYVSNMCRAGSSPPTCSVIRYRGV